MWGITDTLLLDLQELHVLWIGEPLLGTPFVQKAHLMNATDGAEWIAVFLCIEFSPDVFDGISFKRNAWITPLLRAPMHKAVFANIKVTCSRPTLPIVGLPFDKISLK